MCWWTAGVIAMVAMTPVLSIIILGAVFQRRTWKHKEPAMLEETVAPAPVVWARQQL